jgi:hypothetical protein
MRRQDLGLSFSVVALAALVSLSAQATPLLAPTKTYSPVEEVGCRGPGAFCPADRHWVCERSRCSCAPCAPGGPRPWGPRRITPGGGPSTEVAPRATPLHYIVLDETGHCAVVDSKPSAGSSLKIVGDQGGYTSLESANKALKDSRSKCKDGADAKFKAAQLKARQYGVETLTQKDIEGLSLEQIKQLRGY